MTERIPCKTPGCTCTILPETAERTGGFCMPCVQRRSRGEYEDYVRKNRVDVNPFEGLTDRVEIIRLMHQSRPHDPLVNLIPYPHPLDILYSELSTSEIQRLMDYAISCLHGKQIQVARQIVLSLAAFTTATLESLHEQFILTDNIYPGLIFRQASPRIRDSLLERIHNPSQNLDHLLKALAWIGDPVVVDHFARWRLDPPASFQRLRVLSSRYTQEAGWELTEDGHRRNLYSQECYPLYVAQSDRNSPVQFMVPHHEDCRWCGRKLVNLFSFECSDHRLSLLNVQLSCLSIPLCRNCTVYGEQIFTRVQPDGTTIWSDFSPRPNYPPIDQSDGVDLSPKPLTLATTPRNALHAASEFLRTTFSQVGGHPTWIQGAGYPVCPSCQQTMRFIGQVANEELTELCEGIYYSFLCDECMLTTTTFQQT